MADAIGADWFGARSILQKLTGTEEIPAQRLWRTATGPQLETLRDRDRSIDRRLDQATIDELVSREHVVGDSWALPWLAVPSKVSVVRVWLESSFETRVLKFVAAHLDDLPISESDAQDLVADKDRRTQQRFLDAHGFDLFVDRDPFALILDNSRYIDRPSRPAARRGIAAFAPIFEAAVRTAGGSPTASDAETLESAPDGVIVRLQPVR